MPLPAHHHPPAHLPAMGDVVYRFRMGRRCVYLATMRRLLWYYYLSDRLKSALPIVPPTTRPHPPHPVLSDLKFRSEMATAHQALRCILPEF